MTRPPEIRKRTSSGGVIYRPGASRENTCSGIEVALVAVKGGNVWCLPKGLIDKGEDAPEAAVREVKEETGLNGEIIDKIGYISYWYFLRDEMIRIHKTVHFYLLHFIEGRTDDHDHEVDEARWFPIDEAVKVLSYKSEKEIMQKARTMILSAQERKSVSS